jgi:CHAD domain-containing protein
LTGADTPPVRPLDLLSSYLVRAFDRFNDHLGGVGRGEDLEAVHQARVGIRRMRCTLRTYRPVFDRLWARSVRNAAVLFAYPLGRVRDADVTLQRERALAEERTIEAGIVLDALEKIRRARREHLVLVLGSAQAHETLELMRDAVLRPRLIAGAGTTTDDLVDRAGSAWRKVRKAVRRLPADPSDADLHRVRILTKRARYAAEVLRPVVGDDAKTFCRSAASLQDALGGSQDAAVARAWLHELIPALDGDGLEQARALAEAEQERAEIARTAWPPFWERLAGSSAWLGD